MSAWCPHKSKTGELPISLTLSKNMNLQVCSLVFFSLLLHTSFLYFSISLLLKGTKLMDIEFCKLSCILALELQQGKEKMLVQNHCAALGLTAACTLRLINMEMV